MSTQLRLFEHDSEKEETTPTYDKIMATLEFLSASAEYDCKLLSALIEDIQKDWTEDEKLQINNPKEWERQQKLKQPKKEVIMPEVTAQEIEVLKNCKVEGLIVKLPEIQLERSLYVSVKNKLELIGGKWKGGKAMGFVFPADPTELLEQISNGEKRNLKKEFQFFGTPDSLADRLVLLAEIDEDHRVLEPSAGQGAIIKAINRIYPEMMVECFELMPINQTFLQKIDTAVVIGDDFLKADEPLMFDRIIANPPFNKNQDIDHIRKMYELTISGGRIVSVASKHWQHSSNKKEIAFKKWVKEIGAEIIEVDAGEFKESGTSIATVIIVINKP